MKRRRFFADSQLLPDSGCISYGQRVYWRIPYKSTCIACEFNMQKFDTKTFQGLILTLQDYWARQGCTIVQPLDMEVGAEPLTR